MAADYLRSRSFITVGLGDPVAAIARRLHGDRSRFVLAETPGEDPTFYFVERIRLLRRLARYVSDQLSAGDRDGLLITLGEALDAGVTLMKVVQALPKGSKVSHRKPSTFVRTHDGTPIEIVFPRRGTAAAGGAVEAGGSVIVSAGGGVRSITGVKIESIDVPMESPPVMSRGSGGGQRSKPRDLGEAAAGADAANTPTSGGAGPPPPVYPAIRVSDEHPLQGSSIDITVSLDFTRSSDTAGSAQLPADDREHVIEVHLLFGEESRWGELRFQRPTGTLEAAVFKHVKVPVLPVREDRTVAPERIEGVVVNFYLESRWCGEGVRHVQVRSSKRVARLAEVPAPQQPEWLQHVLVEPGASPPDLLVRILEKSPSEYYWTMISPHRNFAHLPDGERKITLAPTPYAFVRTKLEVFVSATLDDAKIDDLLGVLDLIWGAAPVAFKKAYWELFHLARKPGSRVTLNSIQFVSDEPYVPWELMRVFDLDQAPDEQPEILAVRHAVGRWSARSSRKLRQSLQVRDIAVFATGYDGVERIPEKLPWVAAERDELVKRFAAKPQTMVVADVVRFLAKGTAQLLHFSCHGKANAQTVDEAILRMEDADLRATSVSSPEAQLGVGQQRPLVFLNACQAGAAGGTLGMVFGWPQAFVTMGATACVAPLWSVVDATAKDVALEFYREVLRARGAGEDAPALGEVLQRIRAVWRERRSLTHLSYVLYGDPTMRLDWQQGAATGALVPPESQP